MKGDSQQHHEIDFSLETIGEAAKEFLDTIGNKRVILFDGEMGAGKTTFIAELCKRLGADDDFGSPTFSLVNVYEDGTGKPIYHFDLYRIDTPQEAFEMGALDYLESGDLCLIEWPDRLGPLTPDDALDVYISVNADGSRKIRY